MPAATAILDRFLHQAEVITSTGKSYRLRNHARQAKAGKGKNTKAESHARPYQEPIK